MVVSASPAGRVLLEQGRARRIAELTRLLEGLTDGELASVDAAARIVERIDASSIRTQHVCWRYRGKEVVRLER
ncbi:MAG TPA: hypothetical protein VFT33_05130 [Gaiellaceae bacterium]|nr:hypothetical protein [Gaiellaceae bacterium]